MYRYISYESCSHFDSLPLPSSSSWSRNLLVAKATATQCRAEAESARRRAARAEARVADDAAGAAARGAQALDESNVLRAELAALRAASREGRAIASNERAGA